MAAATKQHTESEDPVVSLRPDYKKKFPVHTVKEIIRGVLSTKLGGQTYHMDYTSKWSKEIADAVRDKCKELQLPRYKFMVQVIIGEKKGQGVRTGCRCYWDTETDNLATAEFVSVRIPI